MRPEPAWLRQFPSAEVRALDPRRHTLIEASAGTGKTFAVEHLVLRLLMENHDWMPEEILLLSFTEKTAADLRARIRALLHRQVRPGTEGPDKPPIPGWDEEELKRLGQLWTHADDLAVHTLHAFCQSSLRRDPLASDVPIRDEVAEDRGLAEDALENLLREHWPRDPARLVRLRDALDIGSGEGWRRKLVQAALAWQPWRGDRLDPAPAPEILPTLQADISAACTAVREAIEAVNAGTLPLGDYLSCLPAKGAESNAFIKVGRMATGIRDEDAFLRSLVETFYGRYEHGKEKAGKTKAFRNGFVSLLEATRGRANAALPEWRTLAAACDAALRLGLRVEREKVLDALRLRAQAVRELREELAREKRRRGCISYDDMPANLVRALRENPELAARIRRRYKACIVDEFQDTDPVQWEILEKLCLQDAPGARAALPLFLVGDPKQAIYGFRGGDLRTYLAARGAFRSMAEEGRAQGFGLEANFRSRPALIEGLNSVFQHSGWFGAATPAPPDPAWRLPPDSGDVSFTPARAGRPEDDRTPRLVLREFATTGDEPPKKSEVDREMRRWIAARVVGLLETNQCKASDIAVLVRKNTEGEALERLLRRRGVPCRIRRRGGVFQGAAADALRLLLEWIGDAADPDVQARILLLPFARRDARDLPRGRPARVPSLIAEWAALAHAGRWPEFFEAVSIRSGYRTRLAEQSPSEAERFDRLVRRLAEAGSAPRLTVRDLRDRFDALRRGEGEDQGGEEDDSAPDSVTVMTLHMSKGLEFPIVFLAASGEGADVDHYVLRPTGEPGFRITLDIKDPEARAEYAAQERAEEKRLFYVAFTRAKNVLYIPILPRAYRLRTSGPLGGFAADALRSAADAHPDLFHWDQEEVRDLVRAQPAPPSVDETRGTADREEALAAARVAFARGRLLSSYSGLARRALAAEAEALEHAEDVLEDSGARVRRQEPTPEVLPPEETPTSPHSGFSADDLPPGAAAGTALHAIFERTRFSSVADAPDPASWLQVPGRREEIEERLQRESLPPDRADVAARVVWNTLRMPLPDPAGGDAFRLSDLREESDYRHEVEFLLPFRALSVPGPLPEGVSRRGNFLWGFIDLVFRHQGRYYLLDWKSNLLPSYDEASVLRSMEAHRYDIQWKLYAVALDRWLRARLPGYDPALHFGGVHYVYLRGASPDRFSGFACLPTPGQLRTGFPAEIARLLGVEPESA